MIDFRVTFVDFWNCAKPVVSIRLSLICWGNRAMNVYTDPKLLDVAGAMESLPTLPLDGVTESERMIVSATGTDDLTARQFAPKFAPTAGKSCRLLASVVKSTAEQGKGNTGDAIAVSHCPVKRKDPLTRAVSGSSVWAAKDANLRLPPWEGDGDR